MNLSLSPKKIYHFFLIVIAILLFANIVGLFVTFNYPDSSKVEKAVYLFDFNQEANIPAFFSAIILLISSVLLFIISSFKKKAGEKHLAWFVLGIIFGFLAFDEAASIHELLMGPTRDQIDTSGIFYYAWVIPYGILLLIFVALYVPFLIQLPRTTMILFLISGFIFVLGALGFEMLGGNHIEKYGHDMTYNIYYTVEETLEMLGISLFIFTLLQYMAIEWKVFSFILDSHVKNTELVEK